MTIDPDEYDINELRDMARERFGPPGEAEDPAEEEPLFASHPDAGGPRSRDSFHAGLYRELLPLEGKSGDSERPYLASLPESYAAEIVVFEWLGFLLERAGYNSATEALDYYESIDWLTEDVESTLRDYLLGIDEPAVSEAADLDVDDHLLSLVYIARLVSMA